MFQPGFVESENSEIVLKDFDADTLSSLLEFIYTAKITITEENAQVSFSSIILIELASPSSGHPDRSQPPAPLPSQGGGWRGGGQAHRLQQCPYYKVFIVISLLCPKYPYFVQNIPLLSKVSLFCPKYLFLSKISLFFPKCPYFVQKSHKKWWAG